MPKYFKVTVNISQKYEVHITAEDELGAKRKALAHTDFSGRTPVSKTVNATDVAFEGEVRYDVGSRIRHVRFGAGEITELVRSSTNRLDLGHRATVKFDCGKTVVLQFPLPADKLEILG